MITKSPMEKVNIKAKGLESEAWIVGLEERYGGSEAYREMVTKATKEFKHFMPILFSRDVTNAEKNALLGYEGRESAINTEEELRRRLPHLFAESADIDLVKNVARK